MDGAAAAALRIAQLQSQLASLSAPSTTANPSTARTNTSAGTSTQQSFGVLLAQAVSETKSQNAAGAASLTSGPASSLAPLAQSSAQRPLAVSESLRGQSNGRLAPGLLGSIGIGDHKLWAPAARSFRQMAAAAARDGISFGVNSSYRSYQQQVEMAQRKGLYSQGGLAAAPGTSDHGWGRSVDLQLDARALEWLRSHAAQYGFSADVPRESWHWTYAAGK